MQVLGHFPFVYMNEKRNVISSLRRGKKWRTKRQSEKKKLKLNNHDVDVM